MRQNTTSLADVSRCPDAVCRLVHALEPTLPILPDFAPGAASPCLKGTSTCLPYVHVVSGWHMFSEEALGFLRKASQLDVRSGACFDDWQGDEGGGRWPYSFGPPPAPGRAIVTHCNKLLTWYPAFAGRYTSAWGKAYGPCKEFEIAAHPKADYYGTAMWSVCRPAALRAHDLAIGTGGAGREATPPFVMKALYGPRVRLVAALRNPVDRLETSFWAHRHYPLKYATTRLRAR